VEVHCLNDVWTVVI